MTEPANPALALQLHVPNAVTQCTAQRPADQIAQKDEAGRKVKIRPAHCGKDGSMMRHAPLFRLYVVWFGRRVIREALTLLTRRSFEDRGADGQDPSLLKLAKLLVILGDQDIRVGQRTPQGDEVGHAPSVPCLAQVLLKCHLGGAKAGCQLLVLIKQAWPLAAPVWNGKLLPRLC